MNERWREVTEDDDPRERSQYSYDLRAAYEALQRVTAPKPSSAEPEHFYEVVESIEFLLEESLALVDAELGPWLQWQGPAAPDNFAWGLIGLTVDCDSGFFDDPVGAMVGDGTPFYGSGLDKAARAYRRECGWDFSPGDAGVWHVAVAPLGYGGGGETMTWRGNLVGFVILHDRDNDGDYESLAHLWTATGWRRRGIANALVEKALNAFPISRVEAPLTAVGRSVLEAVAPRLL